MQGIKAKEFQTFGHITLEELGPSDNFYRHLEAKLDLNLVRDLVADCYASRGRRWFPTGNSAVLPLPSYFIFVLLLFEVIQVNGELHKLNFSFFNRVQGFPTHIAKWITRTPFLQKPFDK